MRKEIAQFLQAGQEAIARIRVEHVIREQNIWAAYEILELFCEFVLARVPILDSQKLVHLVYVGLTVFLTAGYVDCGAYVARVWGFNSCVIICYMVRNKIIEKLSVIAPSAEIRLKVLKEIAQEYNLEWDSSNTEAELGKKHADLLAGSKQIVAEAALSQSPMKLSSPKPSSSNGASPIANIDSKQGSLYLQPPSPMSNMLVVDANEIEPTFRNHSAVSVTDAKRQTTSLSSDVLERARAAIASAERATAAARAAAKLVNVEFGSLKLEGKSS
ncbi:hypothetical protein GH714_041095 [Hevea brasiliensis]|uniref:IST1-like protein n=1 Tax=Hevea brasiliensis TaxID=3981 RepID=A0A6A6MV84_HEVBR|nr:hypothetical protein GH714_041095 [Hevea brasiliensis]